MGAKNSVVIALLALAAGLILAGTGCQAGLPVVTLSPVSQNTASDDLSTISPTASPMSSPLATPAPASCAPSPLGPASEFNVFILGDINQANGATQGRMAAAGDIALSAYRVGDSLDRAAPAGQNKVVAGRDVSLSHGQVDDGNVIYGRRAEVDATVTIDGELRQEQPINFSEAAGSLQELAAYWMGLPAGGTTEVESHGQTTAQVTLTGSDPSLNIFTLSAEDLAAANSLSINSPAGSTVIVNIEGTNGQMKNFNFSFTGVDPAYVYYNFGDADRLTVRSISIEGNILAPFAAIAINNASIHGTVVGGSLEGSAQVQYSPPAGCAPWPLDEGQAAVSEG